MTDLILRKMELIALGQKGRVAITPKGKHPPCFESLRQYHDWLHSVNPETGSPVPARKDWPHEPNYCRDCTREYRNEMRAAGRCLFPDTQFIEVGETYEDRETVGYTP